ncbi:peptide chain release factor N(5)-glutamine methyltransferase [Patescibacteria group bacterium]|nr:peptide chain release factor N(5)-glutamine methyltransferase [Patescibacteria group bacterium]MBU1891018.1 peptide chain release factor N(5)-glutamine methyltransferase [Patescibacteria group bacterium]
MTIHQALLRGYQILKSHDIDSAYIDADIIMSSFINKTRSFLYTHPEKEISNLLFTNYIEAIKKRSNNVPISYITNKCNFKNKYFFIDKHVLIPRPETELLVNKSISLISKINKNNVVVADIGTGSGIIAISIAIDCPSANLLATDISKPALTIARLNSKSFKTNKRISFIYGSLLSPIINKDIDLIVANLPYLKTDELSFNTYEPNIALSAGSDGLLFYSRLIKQISQLGHQPEYICLEIGHDQYSKLDILAKTYLPDFSSVVHKDLNGFDRVLILSR